MAPAWRSARLTLLGVVPLLLAGLSAPAAAAAANEPPPSGPAVDELVPGPAHGVTAPGLTLRALDGAAAPAAPPGAAPLGEGGGYGCTPYLDYETTVGEDDYLEETVEVKYLGEVECNFYLWSIAVVAYTFDRSPNFNGQSFDGIELDKTLLDYREWDYYAYGLGDFERAASAYDGARRIEPAVEMLLEAPEGFIWEECAPLPGMRYLEPCQGLGTNKLYTMVGTGPEDSGMTRTCRDLTAPVDAEQARVTRTLNNVPASTQLLRLIPTMKDRVTAFKRDLCELPGGGDATTFATSQGQALWEAATALARGGQGDDRQLYWARLSMLRALAQWVELGVDPTVPMRALDRASRGMNSHTFTTGGRKVLVSGFDPFFLDQTTNAILRGNPSGSAVLRLDGTTVGGAEVQAVVFPVRYFDFAQGLVEQVFTGHIGPGPQRADLITTVSQGGDIFDLEFYNGRRRSTDAPDNVNEPGGGSDANPIVPGGMGPGEEFVQTTLPVDHMQITSTFAVDVNVGVREISPEPPRAITCPGPANQPRTCTDGPSLVVTKAVEGGGGSYLSNEIAYRVTRLRDSLGSSLPAGHVHTPALAIPTGLSDSAYTTKREQIAAQYRQILTAAIGAPAGPPIALTADRSTYQVGERPVYSVTGPPSQPVTWSGIRNGQVVERELSFGHGTDPAGRWTGSYHSWRSNQVGDWLRYVRVKGRLAKVALSVAPPAPLPPRVAADFDGDDRTDIAVWRPGDGVWYVLPSSGGSSGFAFGQSGDLPVDADFDGNGTTDYAVFRPGNGTWYIHTGTSYTAVPFGLAGDIPVPGDYDRDGRADIAVWRPTDGTWYILPSRGTPWFSFALGVAGDVPVRGDYDGDDITDAAVFRASTGTWLIRQSSDEQVVQVTLGRIKDTAVPADYDGDGRTDVAIFEDTSFGTWRILQSSTGTIRSLFNHGSRLTTPVPGDYDGDGRADFGVFTRSTGFWSIRYNTGGTSSATWGQADDIPIPGR